MPASRRQCGKRKENRYQKKRLPQVAYVVNEKKTGTKKLAHQKSLCG